MYFSKSGEVQSLCQEEFDGREYFNEVYDIPIDKMAEAMFSDTHPFMREFVQERGHTGKNNGILQVKSIHPLWKISCKHFTGEVWVLNELAYWATLFESDTPSVQHVVKSTTQGVEISCGNVRWDNPLGINHPPVENF